MNLPGKVAEALLKNKLTLALCLEEKKDKIQILTLQSQLTYIPQNKILHASNYTIPLNQPQSNLLQKLQLIQEKRTQLQTKIDLLPLWELLSEEPPQKYTLSELAELYYTNTIHSDQEAALLRTLYDTQNIYFKKLKNLFLPNPPNVVKKILQQQQNAKKKELQLQQALQWLKNIYHSPHQPNLENPPPQELQQEIVQNLKDYLLHDQGKLAKTLLKKLQLENKTSAFQILVHLNEFDPDENLLLQKYKIQEKFPPHLLLEAEKLKQNFPSLLQKVQPQRLDLRHLPIYAIDEPSTKDRDDAISIEFKKNLYRIGVHITDVAELLPLQHPLAQLGLERASTIYTPDKTIDMLPPNIAEDILSLNEGKTRLALSVFMELPPNGKIQDFHIHETYLNVKKNFTYQEIDQKIQQKDQTFTTLHQIARNLFQQRLQNGAQPIFFPFYEVKLNPKKEITLHQVLQLRPSQFLVSELMIWANHLFARYLCQHHLPAIYRAQKTPQNFPTPPQHYDYLQLFHIRKYIKKTTLQTYPESHFTLGLEEYLQATSPIRRFSDIVNQHQIKATLHHQEGLSSHEIQNIIHQIQIPLEHNKQIMRQRKEYWILKYLQQHFEGKTLPAICLHNSSPRLLTQIHENLPSPHQIQPHLWETPILYPQNLTIQPGHWILVKLHHINPIEHRLEAAFYKTL